MATQEGPLLFSLTEYVRAFYVFVKKATDDMMSEKEQMLKRIQRVTSGEMSVTQNTAPDGTVVSNEPMLLSMPFKFNIAGVIRGDIDEEIGTAIDASAEAVLQQIMPGLLDHIDRIAKAFGNSVDAKGRPMSHDLLLDLLERVTIEFDENGEPDLASYMFAQKQTLNGKSTVKTCGLMELAQSLPPMTEAQQTRFADIVKKKRHENSARRRNRQLY